MRTLVIAEMEVSFVGLENIAGKTSLVNIIRNGVFHADTIFTHGSSRREVTKGNVMMKIWDLGGKPKFRRLWKRYCGEASAIVYVVDAADRDNCTSSKIELHKLLAKPSLSGIPLLVLGNKIDKPGGLSKEALTDEMMLKTITDREVSCFMISCKDSTNIDTAISWLLKHSKPKN